MKARSIAVFLLVSVCSLFGMTACPSKPVPNVPDVILPIPEDAGDEEPSLDASRYPDCSRACTRLRSLGCEEGLTPDGGLSCYAVCAKAEASGTFTLKPACVASKTSRDGVRSCGTVRCGAK